jgi:hypothetical protein
VPCVASDLAAGGVLHHAGHEAVGVVAHEVEKGLWMDGCVLQTGRRRGAC